MVGKDEDEGSKSERPRTELIEMGLILGLGLGL